MKNKINFIFITMILFPLFEFKADIDKNIEIYNFYFEEIAKKDRIEALLILNILELAQKRSQYTLDFWDRYINFLNNFNKIIFITIDRMRNPSKHLDDEILNRKILDYDFLNFIFEINHVYDRYATLLNVGYENLLSDKSKEYLDKIRNNKNFNESLFKKISKIYSTIQKFFKQDDKKNNIRFFKELFDFILNKKFKEAYIEIDRSICKLYSINNEISISFNEKYRDFWNLIENYRCENLRKEYKKCFEFYLNFFKENPKIILIDENNFIVETDRELLI